MNSQDFLAKGGYCMKYFKKIGDEFVETPVQKIKKGDLFRTDSKGMEPHSAGGLLPAVWDEKTVWEAQEDAAIYKGVWGVKSEMTRLLSEKREHLKIRE